MLVLNVIYFTFVLSLVIKNDDRIEKVKSCAQTTIKHIFEDDDILLFMFDDAYHYVFPDYVTNPSMIIDTRKDRTILNTSIGHKQNLVIYSKNFDALLFTLRKLYYNELWFANKTPLRKILLITQIWERKTLAKVFALWWKMEIINVVILSYDLNKMNALIGLMVSDPQTELNKCEAETNLLLTHSCNDIRQVEFPRILRKYKNCNLTFGYDNNGQLKRNQSKAISLNWYILDTISKYLNMTLQTKKVVPDVWLNEDKFQIKVSSFIPCITAGSCSRVYNIMDYIWIVPAPKRILPIEALKLAFKLWWLLEKCKYPNNQRDLVYYFLEICSMTILGSTTNKRLFRVFRFLIVSYLIYSIHIQAVFTGKLVTLLTIPQFYHPIQTLNELSESNNSIITYDSAFCVNVNGTDSDNTNIYRKLKPKFICYSIENYTDLLKTEESTLSYTILTYRDIMEQLTQSFERKYYYFIDNSYFGNLKIVYRTRPLSSFLITLNEIITRMIEFGILDHHNTLYEYFHKKRAVPIVKDKKLSLEDLHPVFVFWIIGVFMASIGFVGELLVNTIKQKHQNE
ncbi:hypothetical protein RN001_006107 [Aquatica leii]|uniref:Ionotropic receptor n=1 Tax=Aquatica leii TaxID=1421715 RepID=A0AAN7PDM5_9COLE|nr:hypothetical protein RN001_006107 [Aquatica leii]